MMLKLNLTIRATSQSLAGAVWVGVIIILVSSAQAQYPPQNLFTLGQKDYANPPDYYNFILKVSPDGMQNTFASGLGFSHGMVVNSAGELFFDEYFGDPTTGNISKFAPDGTRSTFASGVSGPLALDNTGNLFVADNGSGTIYKYTPGGAQSTFAAGVSQNAKLLALDNSGNLFLADNAGGNIFKYTPDGEQSTFASGLNYAVGGMAFNSAGNLFTSQHDPFGHSIFQYTTDGEQSTFISDVGVGSSYLAGLAFDHVGNLWVGSNGTGNIFEFTSEGVPPDGVPVPTLNANGPWLTDLAFQPVPEPSALALAGLGGLTLMLFRRQQRQANRFQIAAQTASRSLA